ncbi:MAG: ABC transporter substrate-binding protein [bacterium]
MIKRHLFIKALLIIITIFIKVATLNAKTLKSEPIEITDFRGKKLILKKPVSRIVCLIESALSGFYMLNEEKRIIGISTNIYNSNVFQYYAKMDERIREKKLPTPGNWDFVNIESVVSLKPDLVVIWSSQTESINALEERGIPVYGVFISKIEDIYKEIRDFGKLTGNTKRAEELINYSQREINRLRKKIEAKSIKSQSVYFMWAQGYMETSCGGSMVNDLIELAGGKNVCAHIQKEHAVINMENLVVWNPEIIVMWYNEKASPEDILTNPQWQKIKAVQSKRIYELPDVFVCDLWTLKYIYSVKLVSKWLHPELFIDVDLEKEKKIMFKSFFNGKL